MHSSLVYASDMRLLVALVFFAAIAAVSLVAKAASPAQVPVPASKPAPKSSPKASAIFVPGAKQLLKLKFIDATAGELLLETLEPTQWQGRPAHHFRATVRTVGLIRFIYPFTQSAEIYFDRERNQPLYVDVRTNERKKIGRTQISLDATKLQGEELEESVDEPGQPKHERKKSWAIVPHAQSLFTILSYIQLQNLRPGQQLSFPVSHDEKNGLFKVEVVRTEKVRTLGGGEKEALVLRVDHESASRFRSSIKDDPLIWLSNDEQKTLLRFQFQHRRGLVFAVPAPI